MTSDRIHHVLLIKEMSDGGICFLPISLTDTYRHCTTRQQKKSPVMQMWSKLHTPFIIVIRGCSLHAVFPKLNLEATLILYSSLSGAVLVFLCFSILNFFVVVLVHFRHQQLVRTVLRRQNATVLPTNIAALIKGKQSYSVIFFWLTLR